jgi:phage gp46-like protein
VGRDPDPPRELTSAVLNKVVYLFEPARMTQARALAWLTKSELAKRIGVSASAIRNLSSQVRQSSSGLL